MDVELDVHRLEVSPRGASPWSWPVSRHEMGLASDALFFPYCELLRRQVLADSPARHLSVTPAYFRTEVMALLEARLLLKRWQEVGHRPTIPTRWRVLDRVARGEAPDLSSSAFIRQIESGPGQRALWRRPLRPLRNLISSGFPRVPLRNIKKDDVAVTTTGSLISAHAAHAGRPVKYVDYREWFPHSTSSSSSEANMRGVIDEAMSIVETSYATVDLELDDVSRDYLTRWLEYALSRATAYVRSAQTRSHPGLKHLWIGTGGSIWARLLFDAVANEGVHVTAHDHGAGGGFRLNREKTVTDLSACHRFMTFTSTQAEATSHSLSENILLQSNPPAVDWIVDPLAARRIPTSSSTPIKKIMVLSNFFRGDAFHHASVLPDPVALDLHASLFWQLREWGYEVLHKPHPDSRTPSPAALHAFGARQLEGYFEEVADQADLLLQIWDAPSTTLRVALSTDLPLVILDFPRDPWRARARELLARRAALVRATFDESNRVLVDMKELREAIEHSPELRDRSFFDAYFSGELHIPADDELWTAE